MHVSAKDLGTGNEQKVTITASTNLSEDEIKKAVREAEEFAKEDKERKDEVELRNHADSLIYNTEKTLKELGDKVSPEDKSRVESEIANVRGALGATDKDAIKNSTDKLTEVSYEVFGKVYQQSAQQADANTAGAEPQQADGEDTVIDADYEVVDDDKK